MSRASRPPSSEQSIRRLLEVCDAVGNFIEYWGFKAIHGRVWTFLALSAQPASQIEIAETLGVSRSLISAAVAELSDRGLVRPISDHRNAPYEAVVDVWPSISDVLRKREWMLLESARIALEALLEEVVIAEGRGEEPAFNADRIRLLLTMTEMAQSLLKVLIAIRMPKSLDTLAAWVGRARTLLGALSRRE